MRSGVISSADEEGVVEMELSCGEWEDKMNRALTAGKDFARRRGGWNLEEKEE